MGLFHLFQTTHGLTECRIVNPFKAQAQVKAHLVYPLPAGFVVSAIFENLPGVAHEAYFRVRNDDIAPSLGAQPGGVRDAGGVHHDRQSPALIATKSESRSHCHQAVRTPANLVRSAAGQSLLGR